jgi:hypothetical protein
MMPLFHELEEDVGLFRFNVDIPQLIELCGAQRKSIHVAKSVMLPFALPLRRNGQNSKAYAT